MNYLFYHVIKIVFLRKNVKNAQKIDFIE